ncbi:MAG TPA: hypothetical protein VIL53_04660 [Solirubrobacterales bacterium]|jgi:predicted transcriptional regulator
MSTQRRKRLFENIIRLRRAERETPNPELPPVREELERELGETVSKHLAAQLLGVSHTALNRWIDAGYVPLVTTREGRKQVPVSALLELFERVNEERSAGRRRLHTLEPVMSEARARAQRMRPDSVLTGEPEERDRHRISELRSLAYHRAIARRLRRPMVEEAQRRLRRWMSAGRIDPRHAKAWEDVFKQPVSEIRKLISADTPSGRDLRQNSPFAGLLSEPERRKILEKVR